MKIWSDFGTGFHNTPEENGKMKNKCINWNLKIMSIGWVGENLKFPMYLK